jgi:hypothetical protein
MEHERSTAEPNVLLFETSPYGNVDAIVQHDGRSVYFYLNGRVETTNPASARSFGARAVWVRNLQMGPYVINEDEMRSGLQPMLPRTHTKSNDAGTLPCTENLKIVWLEEGNGAALIETSKATESTRELATEKLIAVIPPWSGLDGFHGYAADCAAEGPLCWPLPDNPNLLQRIERASEFWASFAHRPDPFEWLQPEILKHYQNHFLTPADSVESATNKRQNRVTNDIEQYYSIGGDNFPPRGLIHYQTSTHQILATVAMSICPQPMVELFTETPRQFRRIELAIKINPNATTRTLETAISRLSGLANYPWRHNSWLGHGHSCPFAGVFPDQPSVLLVHDKQRYPQRPIQLPTFREDPINLLWLVPISSDQQTRLQAHELTPEQIIHELPAF